MCGIGALYKSCVFCRERDVFSDGEHSTQKDEENENNT